MISNYYISYIRGLSKKLSNISFVPAFPYYMVVTDIISSVFANQ